MGTLGDCGKGCLAIDEEKEEGCGGSKSHKERKETASHKR